MAHYIFPHIFQSTKTNEISLNLYTELSIFFLFLLFSFIAFADRSNLRAHMQTHSVNKQFECSKCRKTFALKSYLNKHLESSCLRDDCKKSNDDKRRNDFDDHSNDASMDDDTIDVTDCSPQADNSVDDFGDDDDDEDINIIT